MADRQATIILHNVPHSLDQRLLHKVVRTAAVELHSTSWEISIRTEDR